MMIMKLMFPLALLLCTTVLCNGYSIDRKVEEAELFDTNKVEEEAQQEEESAFEVNPRDVTEDTEKPEKLEDESPVYKNSLLAVVNQATNQWRANLPKTTFRQPFEYNCAPGSAFSRLYSVHSNLKEDREWQFGCRRVSSTYPTNCQWSAVHGFDYELNVKCAEGYAVTGFKSDSYSAFHRDRRFSVRCCKMPEVGSCASCKMTDFINNWDAVMNYQTGAGKIITGIYSVHDNGREDRRFKVRYCDIVNAKFSTNDCSC